MPLDAPFMLGPFAVGEGGVLALRAPDGHAGLRLRWQDRSIHARLDPAGRLAVRAVLGRVPSSAGAQAGRRRAGLAAVTALRRSLPAGWSLTLLADHRLAAETVRALVAALTCAVLDLGPYLLALDAGVPVLELPAPSVGSANTWPG